VFYTPAVLNPVKLRSVTTDLQQPCTSQLCFTGKLCLIESKPHVSKHKGRDQAFRKNMEKKEMFYCIFILDGPGIDCQWGARFSVPVQTGPGSHPAPDTMDTGLAPMLKKE
jgi:hypothetical protein